MPIDFLKVIKSTAEQVVSQHTDIPENKKQQVVEVATHSVAADLHDMAKPENLSSLTSLLSGGGSGGGLLDGIKNNLIGSLASKVGLDKGVAGSIASGILPKIMEFLSGKASGGIDIGSLLGGLGNLGGGGVKGLLHTITGLFTGDK